MPFKAGAIYGEAILDTKKWMGGLSAMQKSTVLATGVITAAFVAAMAVSARATNEYAKALSNVSTLIDTNAISMKDLSKQLIQLNPELGNTTELTRGLYQSFSSGAKTAEEAMELTTTGAKFAKAALTDTFTAVDVLSTAMNAYGKEVVDAEHASDVFFNTIKLGKITGEQLAASIGTSIPLYSSVGISLEELSSGLAAMTKQGISANRATTQLNAIVNSFLKPSQDMTAQLESMGFASGSAFLETEGLSGALSMLEEATKGDATQLAKLLPNIRALKGVMALTGTGAEEFNFILGEMDDVLGMNQEAFDKQEKTWETAKNALHKVGLEVGVVSKEFVDGLATGLTEVSEWFINLSEGSKEFISTFVVVGATVGVVTLAVYGLNAAFIALAANPVTAALIGIGLLVTATITLSKSLESKAIKEASGRFKAIGEEVGVTADKVEDLGAGMLSLERYFEAQKDNPYSNAEQSVEGMKRQIAEISEYRGIEQEQLIATALTSEKITKEQKALLMELQDHLVATRELLAAEEKSLGFASGMSVKRELAKLSAEHEATAQGIINRQLEEQKAIEDKIESDKRERALKEEARVKGVIEARITATAAYSKAQEEATVRLNLGILSEQESLEANISAAEAFRDALISIGYDGIDEVNKKVEEGDIALRSTLTTLETQKSILGDIIQDELDLAETTTESNDEIEESTMTMLDHLKTNWKQYFSSITTGLSEILSMSFANTQQQYTNDKAVLDLKSQEDLARLEEDYANSIITEAEYEAQKETLEAESKAKLNVLNKKFFEAEKKNKKSNIIMSGLSSIMGWWEQAPKLGPVAGPIFAGIMSGAIAGLSLKQVGLVNEQQFVPALASGGMGSGPTRVHEEGGEIINLPDGSLVIPNDISRQIANGSGTSNVMNVSFSGATISSNMDMNKIVDQVSRKLGRQLRTA